MGRIKDYDMIKEIIDITFMEYTQYYKYSNGYQEFIYGRLTGILYTSVMVGAITLEEYYYIEKARIAVTPYKHSFNVRD